MENEKKKSEGELLQDKLFYTKKSAFEVMKADELDAAMDYARGYADFLNGSKTEREAVKYAVSALDDDGIVLICVYPGHAEGQAEGEMLCEYLGKNLDRREHCVGMFKILNSPTSPFFIAVEKK